ncbi:MAG: hypothetical protein RR056_00015 [Acetivibrio sp.]
MQLMIVLFTGFLLFGMGEKAISQGSQNLKISQGRVERPGYGEGSREQKIEIQVQKGKEKAFFKKKEISLEIEERKYNEVEWENAVIKAEKYIRQTYLGENINEKEVNQSLVLKKEIPDSGISVDWNVGYDGIIKGDGSIDWDKAGEAKRAVTLVAKLFSEEWEKEVTLTFLVVPKVFTKEELFLKRFQELYRQREREGKTEKEIYLPEKIDGLKVRYEEPKEDKLEIFFVLGILAAVLVPLGEKQRIKNEEKRRNKQLELDYPNMVNKFVLLLGAGMTIGGAWKKISDTYSDKRIEENGKKRYVYEEMLFTRKEMENGIAEVRAYEAFGKRCQRMEYLKFSTLLSQNLRKGSARILELLEEETMEAFENRKEGAKKQGEEAGTKLLFPMILMLLLVMLLIIIPAFTNF